LERKRVSLLNTISTINAIDSDFEDRYFDVLGDADDDEDDQDLPLGGVWYKHPAQYSRRKLLPQLTLIGLLLIVPKTHPHQMDRALGFQKFKFERSISFQRAPIFPSPLIFKY
jgi:hypothetical protein